MSPVEELVALQVRGGSLVASLLPTSEVVIRLIRIDRWGIASLLHLRRKRFSIHARIDRHPFITYKTTLYSTEFWCQTGISIQLMIFMFFSFKILVSRILTSMLPGMV